MTAYTRLSPDRRILTIKRRTPAGIQTVTLHRQEQAGPFTDADVANAVSLVPEGRGMQHGQRNKTRRAVTRYGTLWTHLMLGPPTWWLPRLRRERDGTLMAGWLRAAVAVKLDRSEKKQ